MHATSHTLLEQTIGRSIAVSPAPDGRHLDLLLPPRPVGEAAPVRGIYWLERTEPGQVARLPEVSPLPAPDALVRLVSDTWGARLLDDDMRRHEFIRACDFLAAVRARILRYADGPSDLLAAAHSLVRDSTSPSPRGRMRA
jgi:hypothetical protein